MGIVGIGAIMLLVVLIVYLRMIDKRLKKHSHSARADELIVEQANTLVDFGRDVDARKLLQKALHERPDSVAIRARLESIRTEPNE